MAMQRKHGRFGIRGGRSESGALKRLLRALDELRAQRLSRSIVLRTALPAMPMAHVIPLPLREEATCQTPHRQWARRVLARSAAAAMLCVGLGTGLGACDLGSSDKDKDVAGVEDTVDTAQQELVEDIQPLDLPLDKDEFGPDVPEPQDLVPDVEPVDVPPVDVIEDLGPVDVVPDEIEPDAVDVTPDDVLPDVPLGTDCWTDADCAEEQHCEGAVTCPEGALCILPASPGTCVADTNPTECETDADCPEGQECMTLGGCPDGMFCILPVNPTTVCIDKARECYVDAQCPDGWQCVGASTCPEGAICILPSSPGICEDVPQECYSDAECAEGEECVGGFTCPDGAFCVLPNSPGTCQPAALQCYSDEDCPDGQVCVGAITCPEGMFCVLPNQPGECQSGPMYVLPPNPSASKPVPPQASKVWDAFMDQAAETFGKKR